MDVCKSLEMANPNDSENPIKTGNMITLNNVNENIATMNHINNLNTVGSTTYNSYAFIGYRKLCTECDFYWEERVNK